MGFVDDDGVVGAQEGIEACLGEKDAVRHEFDLRFGRGLAIEPVAIADESANGALQLVRDAFRHRDRCESPGLRDGDAVCVRFERHFGKLGRLTGAGVAADDDDGTFLERSQDLRPVFAHGQFGRIVERMIVHG